VLEAVIKSKLSAIKETIRLNGDAPSSRTGCPMGMGHRKRDLALILRQWTLQVL
jgi:hypothetical protein